MSRNKVGPGVCMRCGNERRLVGRKLCNPCYVFYARLKRDGGKGWDELEAEGKCGSSSRKCRHSDVRTAIVGGECSGECAVCECEKQVSEVAQ